MLIVGGALAAVTTARSGQELQPAPPASPSPSRTESAGPIPRTAPTVPYVLDQKLYVEGEQVSGDGWSVWPGDAGWIAIRADNTWWWGRGPQANEISGTHDVPPVISPNGRYVAEARVENGEGVLTGFDTRPSGEGMGGTPIDLGDRQDGSAVTVRAVTNDGKVIAQGSNTSLLWLPYVDQSTVDLAETAPGQVILGNSPAGLVVTDGEGGEPYLAEISDAGELTRVGALPAHDDVAVSPGAAWVVRTLPGTTQGEVTSITALEAQTIDGAQQVTLNAPKGWGFRLRAWVWEDDDHLVSPVVADDGSERMARCRVQPARCVLVRAD